MRLLLILIGLALATISYAGDLEIIQDGQRYTCKPDNGDGYENTCAQVTKKKFGYISSDCFKITNDAQDACAVATINKFGYVASDCLDLIGGEKCALHTLEKFGYVASDCKKIENRRQDACAIDSLKSHGYVMSDCFRL